MQERSLYYNFGMAAIAASPLGILILLLYFSAAIIIGRIARRPRASSNDFLNASRSLPLWIVSASFLAANCGALEIMGLSAMAAEFGAQAFQFYWIGAIPGMIFVGLWMIPIYMKSKVCSVPEYLEERFSLNFRLLNAYITAFILLSLCGISLYAMGQVLHVMFGLGYAVGILLSAGIVLAYVLLGGVRASIYNEVFLLLVLLAGLVPLFVHVLPLVQLSANEPRNWHLWKNMPFTSGAAPFDQIGVIIGLGFVLSFSYWGTDFVLIQRALASRTESEARQVPLWAGFGKLVFSFLVVLPGLAAEKIIPHLGTIYRYDQALPLMMRHFYGPCMLGIGFTALVASLMAGLGGYVSGFAAIWTQDIYRIQLRPGQSESHYSKVGYLSNIAAIVIGVAASSMTFHFKMLMDQVQLLFSLFSAPFWGIFLLGMTSRKTTSIGALAGFLSGISVATVYRFSAMRGWIHFGSSMNANFHVAIVAFVITVVVAQLVSRAEKNETVSRRVPLHFDWRAAWNREHGPMLFLLSGVLLICCIALNVYWR